MSEVTSEFGPGKGEEWRSLYQTQLDLRASLHDAETEDERVELLRQLREARDNISRLENTEAEDGSVAVAVDEPSRPTGGLGGATTAATNTAVGGEAVDSSRTKPRRSMFLVAVGALVLLLGGAALGYLAAQVDDDGSSAAGSTSEGDSAAVLNANSADDRSGAATTAASETATSTTQEEEESQSTDGEAGGVVPIVVADPIAALYFDDYQFSVEAVVADSDLAIALGAAVDKTYGEFGSSTISAEASVPVEPWTDRLMYVVKNFPRLIDGSLLIGDDGVVLTGRAPSEEAYDYFIDELSPENGFPPLDVGGLEIVDLEAPSLDVEVVDGVMTVEGTVPSLEMRDRIMQKGVELYGAENVVADIEIDDELFPLFDVARFPQVVSVFSVGGDFEVKMIEGGFFGLLENGLNFDTGSADLSSQGRQTLSGFPALIARTTVEITIVGHTDSTGPEERNQVLSEARAQSVAALLESLGVDGSRLVVIGEGESKPLASNSTQDGRAKNRRVVITMGFDTD